MVEMVEMVEMVKWMATEGTREIVTLLKKEMEVTSSSLLQWTRRSNSCENFNRQ